MLLMAAPLSSCEIVWKIYLLYYQHTSISYTAQSYVLFKTKLKIISNLWQFFKVQVKEDQRWVNEYDCTQTMVFMIVIKDTLFCFVIFMLNLNLLFINVSLGIN